MKIFNLPPLTGTGSGLHTSIWFTMPDSTVLRSGNPFFIPDFDTSFEALPALAVKIGRLGKGIAPRFAGRYYSEFTAAVTIRAVNLLNHLREHGMPWDPATVFDKSCLLGDFIPVDRMSESSELDFRVCGTSLTVPLAGMRERIDNAIAAISVYNIIKMGDVILLPLSTEGIQLFTETSLSTNFENTEILDIRIK